MPEEFTDNTTIHYEREGGGPALVLLAGYACDLSVWSSVRPMLAEEFSLILVDNRGVGRSGCPDGSWSVGEMAGDVAELLRRLEIPRAHVLGHSMGGAIAQELAFRHSRVVERLVLVNSLIRFRAPAAAAFAWLLKLRESGLQPSELIEGVMPWLHSDRFLEDPEKVREALASFEANAWPQSLAGQRRQFDALVTFDSSPWFSDIVARTLVIAGERDLCTGVADSERLAAGIRDAGLVRIPGWAHLSLLEDPTTFVRIVREFLLAP